jgi:hypothetical protein
MYLQAVMWPAAVMVWCLTQLLLLLLLYCCGG